jgi:sRNA-binding protein
MRRARAFWHCYERALLLSYYCPCGKMVAEPLDHARTLLAALRPAVQAPGSAAAAADRSAAAAAALVASAAEGAAAAEGTTAVFNIDHK